MTDCGYLARREDGAEILRILESAPAKGRIELLYTRRPDAYASYQKEFGESSVFVSKSRGRIVGTCARIIRDVYIGGKPARAAYICGLKKDAGCGQYIGFGGGFLKSLVREDVDCYYCSVVSENKRAQKMFGKPSRIFDIRPLQEYTTYILAPKFTLRTEDRAYGFRQAKKEDTQAVLAFLQTEGKKKELFPVVSSLERFYGLRIEDFYLLESGGEIVAAAALWNQTAYRQYAVKKYRGIMRFARLLNPLLSLLGYIKLPKENECLELSMLSFFLSKDDDPEYYKAFLNALNRKIRKKHKVYVIGMPKSYFAASIFNRLPSIHFDTIIYEIRFRTESKSMREIDQDRLYPECALL